MIKTLIFSLAASLSLHPLNAALTTNMQYVTRAEAVTSIILASKLEIPHVENTGAFRDVAAGSWYEFSMLAAQQMGIITAEAPGNLLHPEKSVNRAEFLKILTLAFKLPTDYPHFYADVSKADWFSPYAGVASKYQLFGANQTRLYPGRILTQTEAADAINQYLRQRPAAQNLSDEQQIARDQAGGNVQLYSVISTRRQKVVFQEEPAAPTQTVRVLKNNLVKPAATLPQLRTEVVQLVNDIRIKHGLKPFTYNALLEQSAQSYATQMSERGFFAHVSPEGSTLKERIQATGYYDRSFSIECFCVKGYSLAENLARGQKTPQEAVDAWMASKSHREAILHADYKDIGIGISAGIWVQHFGGTLLPMAK